MNERVEYWGDEGSCHPKGAKPLWVVGPLGLAAGVLGLQATLIVALAIVTGVGYHMIAYGEAGDLANYTAVGGLTALLYLLPMLSRGQAKPGALIYGRGAPGQIFVAWNIAFLCLAFVGAMTKTTGLFSRAWLLAFYVTGLIGIAAFELAAGRVLAAASAAGHIALRRVMVIGAEREVARLKATMDRGRPDARVVASLALDPGADDETIRSEIDRAIDNARAMRIEDVVILTDGTHNALIERVVAAFSALPVVVHLGVTDLLSRVSEAQVTSFGSIRALSLTAPPLSAVQAATKRGFDIMVSALALCLLAPLFVAIAALIKYDSKGPVFFRQRRRGYNLEEFRIWKFRTMTTLDDGDVVRQATAGDARVTRIGHYLRRYNLDELPQLINVLTGDMSLVGPRPHAVAHDRFFETRIEQYRRRLNVKPGITGWAQINGHRGPTETDAAMRARVEHDLYYIDNWSLWFDIYIMIATVVARKAFRNAI